MSNWSDRRAARPRKTKAVVDSKAEWGANPEEEAENRRQKLEAEEEALDRAGRPNRPRRRKLCDEGDDDVVVDGVDESDNVKMNGANVLILEWLMEFRALCTHLHQGNACKKHHFRT